MQRQQQQPADLDLLAVFNDREHAETATSKLRKEGFSEEEIVRPEAGTVGTGQFREHGPNQNRSAVFLQTTRSGPRPATILLFAVIFGAILALLALAAHAAFAALPEPTSTIIGAVVGVLIGVLVGSLRRGPTRGAIGQDMTRANAPPVQPTDYIAVGIRFENPTNVSRTSRARAILINNGGKIDRSVGRRE